MIALVAGALANKPGNGGNAWARLSWTRGLERLGVEAYFVEQLAAGASASGKAFFEAVFAAWGDRAHAGLFDSRSSPLAGGLDWDRLLAVAERADVLINMSGHLQIPELRRAISTAVYIDDDPGYTQLWHLSGALGDRLAGHRAYYTFGTRIGRAGCRIPTAGVFWRPLLPPVVLDDWPVQPSAGLDRVTTVASWRGPYGRLEHNGILYGQKAHQLRAFASVPSLAGRALEIALEIDPAEHHECEHLNAAGWTLADPRSAAGDPDAFRRYVQDSAAEFSVAQGIYVETQSGWFSDRTTRYLASGKPAVVQDTGFSDTVETGRGLLTFTDPQSAAAALGSLERNFGDHARAARALAEERFDSDTVLSRLLEEVM